MNRKNTNVYTKKNIDEFLYASCDLTSLVLREFCFLGRLNFAASS